MLANNNRKNTNGVCETCFHNSTYHFEPALRQESDANFLATSINQLLLLAQFHNKRLSRLKPIAHMIKPIRQSRTRHADALANTGCNNLAP